MKMNSNEFSIVVVVPMNFTIDDYTTGEKDPNMLFYFYSLYERSRFNQYLSENFKDLWFKLYDPDDVMIEDMVSCRRKGRVKTYTNPDMSSVELEVIHCNSNYILGVYISPEDRARFYTKFFDWTAGNNYKCCHVNPKKVIKEKLGYPDFNEFYDIKV